MIFCSNHKDPTLDGRIGGFKTDCNLNTNSIDSLKWYSVEDCSRTRAFIQAFESISNGCQKKDSVQFKNGEECTGKDLDRDKLLYCTYRKFLAEIKAASC